jgi:vitamin K-dependent gamma-carboxylase
VEQAHRLDGGPAIPLRAYWPGLDPDWRCRGFNFAWRVMLVEKAGSVELLAYFPAAGTERRIRMRDYITERQERMMAQDPFIVRALARHVADDLRTHGFTGVEIRADSFASINGRPLQRLIDPRVDLARPISVPWIVPLRREIE